MTVTKLTIADKQEIVRLYCETDLTTNQLSEQYSISASTVLRLLQEFIPQDDYKQLVKQKQARSKRVLKEPNSMEEISQLNLIDSAIEFIEPYEYVLNNGTSDDSDDEDENDELLDDILDPARVEEDITDIEDVAPDELAGELLDDEFDDESELLDDEDDEDNDGENTELGDGDISAVLDGAHVKINPNLTIAILPLVEADLPSTCYIVIDRAAEIVTRPLQDFKDLGKIPAHELQSRTVPVFDNHRIARRFSNHTQRVVKFPSELIYSTHSRLAKRGITRMLFDGQVFSL
jgi:transposase-like protein